MSQPISEQKLIGLKHPLTVSQSKHYAYGVCLHERVKESGPLRYHSYCIAKFSSPLLLDNTHLSAGGVLKTEAQADAESLQASWWDRESPLPLRGRDILSLIETGLRYLEKPWFTPVLPLDLPCPVVCQRLVLAFAAGIYVWLLVGKGPQGRTSVSGRSVSSEDEVRVQRRRSSDLDIANTHLPVALSTKTHTVTWAAHRLVQECMPSCYYELDINTHGLLGVQHNGRVPGKTDGLCFNTLVSLTVERRGSGGGGSSNSGVPPMEVGGEPADPPPVETDQYHWHKIDNAVLRDAILRRIRQGSTLPVLSLY